MQLKTNNRIEWVSVRNLKLPSVLLASSPGALVFSPQIAGQCWNV